MCLVEFRTVSVAYDATPNVESLRGVSLRVNAGECVLLTGASGSGKSTVLRLLNGLIPEFYRARIEGSVLVQGKDALGVRIEEKAGVIGSVFQNPRAQFFNVDTTSELAFGLENLGVHKEEILQRVCTTVRNFHIEALMDRSMFKLSGGEKQQIACASVDVMAPEILLLDEPSANLDYEATERLHALIAFWKRARKTIVIAEHRINYVWDLADRALILERGAVVREIAKGAMERFTDEDAKRCGLRSLARVSPLSLARLDASGAAGVGAGASGADASASAGAGTGSGAGAGADTSGCEPVTGTGTSAGAGAETDGGSGTESGTASGTATGTASSTESGTNFIFLKNLSYAYQKNHTLFAINSMKIKKSHVTAIVGDNGAGKTTFLEAVCGIRKNRGLVVVDGVTHTCKRPDGTIFMVMQDVNHQLFTESVLDEVLISQPHADEAAAKRALAAVHLDELCDRHPMSLSGGQKQRLALACAVASQAPILLLDEPTSGLDVLHMQMVARVLNQLKGEGRTIITVTHDSEFIECCCDDVLRMEHL